jgi:hypothetical protein
MAGFIGIRTMGERPDFAGSGRLLNMCYSGVRRNS